MGRLPAILAGLMLALGASPGRAGAWTAEMEERVVREAVRLMPISLRRILQTHEADLRAGLREAAGDEVDPSHRLDPRQEGPSAATRAEELASSIVAAIDGHRPFGDVARLMGALAHAVCDLNNPLQVASDDPREERYAGDYAEYVASNLERYPLVFYGWRDPALDGPAGGGPTVRAFAEQIARRARRYYRHIGKAYAPDNRAPLAQRFDVRSLPFGIGSLSYSRSVTDTARIWLHVWKRAHGDIRGTPYLAREMASTGAKGGGVR